MAPVVPTARRRYHIMHPQRRLWRVAINALQSTIILLRHRPWLIVSTGADVTVPTVILGKLFFRATVIYIETCGALTPTLTGRLCYPFADLFVVQWPEQLQRFPRGVLATGPLT